MCPIMFDAIGENTLHVFGAVNFLTIPMVWAFYPETANRTLEEIDMLFASESPFVWDEERMFEQLKAENPSLEHVRQRHPTSGKVDDGEMTEEV